MTLQANLQKDNEMKQFALGVYDNDENRNQLPSDWLCFAQHEEKINGFYGEAYIKNGKIVIVFRGTNFFFNDFHI